MSEIKLTSAEAADEIIGNAEEWWAHYHFQETPRIRDLIENQATMIRYDDLRLAAVDRDDDTPGVATFRLVNGQAFVVTVTAVHESSPDDWNDYGM